MFNRPPQQSSPRWAFLRPMDASVGVCGLPFSPHVVLTQRTQEVLVSLPITARQMNALRALQDTAPELAELASSIALAFDASPSRIRTWPG